MRVPGTRRRPPRVDGAFAACAQGLAAGLIGALAMTGWQELSSKLTAARSDGSGSSEGEDPWEQAPVPAKVARRIGRVVGWDPPAEHIGLLTNAMHYGYGAGWGVVYAVLPTRAADVPPPVRGVLFGTAVWLASYAQLVPMGLYEPPWRYSPTELALDLSYHLVYGAGTALGFVELHRLL
jgi:hypothetical protein